MPRDSKILNRSYKIKMTIKFLVLKYFTALDYAYKTLLVLSGADSSDYFFSFTAVIGVQLLR